MMNTIMVVLLVVFSFAAGFEIIYKMSLHAEEEPSKLYIALASVLFFGLSLLISKLAAISWLIPAVVMLLITIASTAIPLRGQLVGKLLILTILAGIWGIPKGNNLDQALLIVSGAALGVISWSSVAWKNRQQSPSEPAEDDSLQSIRRERMARKKRTR